MKTPAKHTVSNADKRKIAQKQDSKHKARAEDFGEINVNPLSTKQEVVRKLTEK